MTEPGDDSVVVWPHAPPVEPPANNDPQERFLQAMTNLLAGSVRVVLREPNEQLAKGLLAALAIEFRQLAETLWDKTHDG